MPRCVTGVWADESTLCFLYIEGGGESEGKGEGREKEEWKERSGGDVARRKGKENVTGWRREKEG